MSRKLLAGIVAALTILAAQSAAGQTVCKPSRTVAVSAYGLWMGSGGHGGGSGDPSIVAYANLVTNVGSALGRRQQEQDHRSLCRNVRRWM